MTKKMDRADESVLLFGIRSFVNMASQPIRIAIFWHHLYHYRVAFYDKLGRSPNVKLWVYHGGLSEVDESRINESAFQHFKTKIIIKTIFGAVIYFHYGFWRDLIKKKVDIIICEGNFGILSNVPIALYARIFRIPFYYWSGGWTRGKIKGIPAQLRKIFIRIVSKRADGYICYSSAAKAFLQYFGVDPSRCTIVQNTIDTESIEQNRGVYEKKGRKLTADLGLEGKRIILCVGHLRQEKRIDLLVDAFLSLKKSFLDIALVIVGDGPDRERIMFKAGAFPEIKLPGAVFGDEEINPYYSMSSIFVLPGDGGLAINQAMAFGLPVICSEADGTERDLIIDGETGLFFKKGDASDLENKLKIALSSQEMIKSMGAKGCKRLYSIASLSKSADEFIKFVLKRTPSTDSVQ